MKIRVCTGICIYKDEYKSLFGEAFFSRKKEILCVLLFLLV